MEILENLLDLRCFFVARYGYATRLKLAWTTAQAKSPSCECVFASLDVIVIQRFRITFPGRGSVLFISLHPGYINP
jgi:hypothetical protein